MAAHPTTNNPDKSQGLTDLVFVGLNRQVLALDRYTGRIVWEFKVPKGLPKANHVSVGNYLNLCAILKNGQISTE